LIYPRIRGVLSGSESGEGSATLDNSAIERKRSIHNYALGMFERLLFIDLVTAASRRQRRRWH